MSRIANARVAALSICLGTAMLVGCASTSLVDVAPSPTPSTMQTVLSADDLSSRSALDELDRRLRDFRPRNEVQAAHKAKTEALLRIIRQRDRSSLQQAAGIIRAGAAGAPRRTGFVDRATADVAGAGVSYSALGRFSTGSFLPTISSLPSQQRASLTASDPSEGGDLCEHTDEDGVFWSGECASQEEIDDALALVDAALSDSAATHATAQSDSVSYCAAPNNWNDPLCVATFHLMSTSEHLLNHSEHVSGPRIGDYSFEVFEYRALCSNELQGCLSDWGQLSMALGAAGNRIWKLHRMALRTGGAAAAAVEALGWQVSLACLASAWAMLAVYECMQT